MQFIEIPKNNNLNENFNYNNINASTPIINDIEIKNITIQNNSNVYPNVQNNKIFYLNKMIEITDNNKIFFNNQNIINVTKIIFDSNYNIEIITDIQFSIIKILFGTLFYLALFYNFAILFIFIQNN